MMQIPPCYISDDKTASRRKQEAGKKEFDFSGKPLEMLRRKGQNRQGQVFEEEKK
jgi:hypothetical protein